MLKDIIHSNDLISPDEIGDFEKRWGLKLPKSFRTFLLKHNGGRPIPAAFPISGMQNNPIGEIQVFFGLNAKINSSDLNWVLENLGVPQPDGLLPIACTDGGDYICISTNESGRVIFWDRLACWGKDTWSPSDFYLVAEDFDDLLSKLHEHVPEDESEIERILRTDDLDGMVRLLDSGFSIETVDENECTPIERAAIKARPAMIQLLFERGAKLRNALQYAEQNLEFFPKHKTTVDLLKELKLRTGK